MRNGVGTAETAEEPPQPHKKAAIKLMSAAHTLIFALEVCRPTSPASPAITQ